MLWFSSLSVIFFKCVCISLMLSSVLTMVLLQWATMSFINVRENVFNFEYYVSTNSWPWFPIVGSSSSFRPFGTSSSTMHRLRKSLCDLYLTALSLSRFSFSAICSLFFSDDPSCREQCFSLFSSPTSVDVEVWSTSIVGVSSSRFLLDVILLFPSSPSLVFVLKNIADWVRLVWRYICCTVYNGENNSENDITSFGGGRFQGIYMFSPVGFVHAPVKLRDKIK